MSLRSCSSSCSVGFTSSPLRSALHGLGVKLVNHGELMRNAMIVSMMRLMRGLVISVMIMSSP